MSPTLPLTLTRTLLLSYPYQQHKPRKPTRCGWFACCPTSLFPSLSLPLLDDFINPSSSFHTRAAAAAVHKQHRSGAVLRPLAKSAINVSVEKRIEVKFSVEKQNAAGERVRLVCTEGSLVNEKRSDRHTQPSRFLNREIQLFNIELRFLFHTH